MEHLQIEASTKTPQIDFNPQTGIFEITGISVPENAREFYLPALEWVRVYRKSPAQRTTLSVKLSYLNTSSLHTYFEMFSLLKDSLGVDRFFIEWYFLEGDSDMKELGEDFQDALEMDLKIIEVETV